MLLQISIFHSKVGIIKALMPNRFHISKIAIKISSNKIELNKNNK